MDIMKKISDVDFKDFSSIVQEYLPGTSEDELLKRYEDTANIFVGYYLDNKLIGVCFGMGEDKGDFVLDGIAIIFPYGKQGRGSRLLRYFEDAVKSKGYNSISLGSADGYVEHFYLKNGYKLEVLKILTDNDAWKIKSEPLFPVAQVETQGTFTKLVIENIWYKTKDKAWLSNHREFYDGWMTADSDYLGVITALKDKLCEFYCGFDRFYVFGKTLQ